MTRRPYITIMPAEQQNKTLKPPYITTTKGAVFGFAALTDFLLNRHPYPALTDGDAIRRGLEMTVFYALVEREHPKLQLAAKDDATNWLSDVATMLRQNKFYTGDTLSVCDCALVALLDYIWVNHSVRTAESTAYAKRFSDELTALLRRNTDDA